MKVRSVAAIFSLLIAGFGWSPARAAKAPQFPQDVTFTTLITTPRSIEGLTGDNAGNLYVGGAAIAGDTFCPVWRINLSSPALTLVGKIPTPCSLLGIALNNAGDVFVADHVFGDLVVGEIWKFTPDATTPPMPSTPFASGVPGANGLAFDRDGNLFVSDGTTSQGRVWKITGSGADCTASTPINCVELFRIQPMRNSTALGGDIGGDGVGRQARDFPPGTLANTAGGQDLVANGLAFDHSGDLFVADTARGAIWRVNFDQHGKLLSPVDCDDTFHAGTLCLSNIFVAHPILEGADGIALDAAGNIWVDANERNAVAVVTKDGRVLEVFRNPVNASGLRSSGDSATADTHILEFPTGPFLSEKIFCSSNSDGNRRDNAPNNAGEIKPAGPDRGKISCMTDPLTGNLIQLNIPGMPLPVH
jgi:SMP-30/gluconolaconase/LRE-like protein